MPQFDIIMSLAEPTIDSLRYGKQLVCSLLSNSPELGFIKLLADPGAVDKFTAHFYATRFAEQTHKDLKGAPIARMYKREDNHQACDNQCWISRLSIAEKPSRVLPSRLILHLEQVVHTTSEIQ